MFDNKQYVLDFLRKEYKEKNHFYDFLDINIEEAYNGRVVQTMYIDPRYHTNLHSMIHGGVFMTIGDSSMGVACASLGKKVVTLDTSINFLKNVHAPTNIRSEANVVHHGSQTILMKALVSDDKGTTLCSLRSTFYIIGSYKNILNKL